MPKCQENLKYNNIYIYITWQVEAALTTEPDNEELLKLKNDLEVKKRIIIQLMRNSHAKDLQYKLYFCDVYLKYL